MSVNKKVAYPLPRLLGFLLVFLKPPHHQVANRLKERNQTTFQKNYHLLFMLIALMHWLALLIDRSCQLIINDRRMNHLLYYFCFLLPTLQQLLASSLSNSHRHLCPD